VPQAKVECRNIIILGEKKKRIGEKRETGAVSQNINSSYSKATYFQ
jgi:hypothetical protein